MWGARLSATSVFPIQGPFSSPFDMATGSVMNPFEFASLTAITSSIRVSIAGRTASRAVVRHLPVKRARVIALVVALQMSFHWDRVSRAVIFRLVGGSNNITLPLNRDILARYPTDSLSLVMFSENVRETIELLYINCTTRFSDGVSALMRRVLVAPRHARAVRGPAQTMRLTPACMTLTHAWFACTTRRRLPALV